MEAVATDSLRKVPQLVLVQAELLEVDHIAELLREHTHLIARHVQVQEAREPAAPRYIAYVSIRQHTSEYTRILPHTFKFKRHENPPHLDT